MRKEEKINKIVYVFAAFIFIISCILIIHNLSNRPLKLYELEVSFIVSNKLGFDVNSTALKFGEMYPNSSASRTLIIENSYNYSLNGRILASKNLDGIIFAPQNFVVGPEERKNISVSLVLPADYNYGNYSGKVRIELRR